MGEAPQHLTPPTPPASPPSSARAGGAQPKRLVVGRGSPPPPSGGGLRCPGGRQAERSSRVPVPAVGDRHSRARRRPPRRTLPCGAAPAAGGGGRPLPRRGSIGSYCPAARTALPVPQPSPPGGWVCARVCGERASQRQREREREIVLEAHARESYRYMHTHRSVCGTARSPRQATVSPHS